MKYYVLLLITICSCTQNEKEIDTSFEFVLSQVVNASLDIQKQKIVKTNKVLGLSNQKEFLVYQQFIIFLDSLSISLIHNCGGYNINLDLSLKNPLETEIVYKTLFFSNEKNDEKFDSLYVQVLNINPKKHELINYKMKHFFRLNKPNKHLNPAKFYFHDKNLYESLQLITQLKNYLIIKQIEILTTPIAQGE